MQEDPIQPGTPQSYTPATPVPNPVTPYAPAQPATPVPQPQPQPAPQTFAPTAQPSPYAATQPAPVQPPAPMQTPQAYGPAPQPPTPGVAGPQINPYQPTQGFNPAGSGYPPQQPFAPNAFPTSAGRNLKPLLALAGVFAVVVVGALLYFFVFGKHVTYADTQAAQKTSDALFNDMSDINEAFINFDSGNSLNDATNQLNTAKTKLADAQKQFQTLKKSPVQHDGTVHGKFKALDSKWDGYTAYVNDNMSDLQTLLPILTDFESSLEQMSNNPPTTTAGLSSYLTSLKSKIDEANTKTQGVKLKLSENQAILTALQSFLSSASQDIGQAVSDNAGGKGIYTVEDDIFKIDDAQSTFSDASTKAQDQIDSHAKQVDPSSQFEAFRSSLDSLSEKLASSAK